jgi:mono/diheme cytochrome c family protein
MKRLFMRGWLLVLPAALSLMLLSTSAAKSSPKALFVKRCSDCHSPSRAMATKKKSTEWRQTVRRMQMKAGARISAEEAEVIIKYLAEVRGA